MTMQRISWFVIIGVGLLILFMAGLVLQAMAHQDGDMNYPMECCHNQDCAPARVEQVSTTTLASNLAPGQSSLPSMMMVTTIHGSVMVPDGFKTRDSPDGRAHACMMPSPTTGQMRLICLWLPPGT